MTNFSDSPEAKNHQLLLAEKSRLVEKYDQVNQSFKDATEALTRKADALNEIETAFIHGKATAADVDKARLEVDPVNAKLAADQRLLSLANAALKEIDQKIEAAQKDCERARREQLQQLVAELSESLNTKFRDQLLEIKAAKAFTGISYDRDWGHFLMQIFPAPALDEIVQAQDKFCCKHKFER